MNLPNWIRRLSYQPVAVRIVRSLHIRGLMRWAYYRLARPREKKKRICFNGIEVFFYANSPTELRLIETPFERGMGDERVILQKLLQLIKPGDSAYDIGASIGVHTVLMAKKVGIDGSIIAIEPELNSYGALHSNVILNDLKNVIIIQAALGEILGEGAVYCRGITGGFSLLKYFKGSPGQKVKIIPGDTLVQNEKLPLPKVVKIDVEGYEYSVIRGLQNTLRDKACEMVCCEVHPKFLPPEVKPQMVTELLKSFGFSCIETLPRGETFHAFCYKGQAPTQTIL